MSLEDHQTGKPIISPYLSIGFEEAPFREYVINTETFRNCQDWLVVRRTLTEDITSDRYKEEVDAEGTVPVFAVVGDYNTGNRGSTYGINRSVSLSRGPIAREKIGSIPLAILKREIPKVYEAVKEDLETRVKHRDTADCPF